VSNAVKGVGVPDFIGVKFFENRSNGQSKGFCVITMGSDSSRRLCVERLPKKELHGMVPQVTYPTKQAHAVVSAMIINGLFHWFESITISDLALKLGYDSENCFCCAMSRFAVSE